MLHGKCHCGEIRFQIPDQVAFSRSVIAMTAVDNQGRQCNAPLDQMDMMQVTIATLDDPTAVKPQLQIQTAERIGWMESLRDIPAIDRFPG